MSMSAFADCSNAMPSASPKCDGVGQQATDRPLRTLMISNHDFRSLRKTSVHFIMAELAQRSHARFFSLGLSWLSVRRGDTRAFLSHKANQAEISAGVECFLWKTLWHPFNLRYRALRLVEAIIFRVYRAMLPELPRRWIAEADVVLVESGMAPIFLKDIKRLNPAARIIYLASDDLSVIGCAETIRRYFARDFCLIDTVRLPSRHLLAGLPHGRTAVYAPHGLDPAITKTRYDDPYGGRPSCVSVGCMLFDPSFFRIAAHAYPGIDFHIIGASHFARELCLPNIVVHEEMSFSDTLPYVQHALFGVAPYRTANQPLYLADTSLKLRQFGLFGIPAVCPTFVTDGHPGRFGYTPGERSSIVGAIEDALSCVEVTVSASLSWSDVVDRILSPGDYDDTNLT